jgi:hypothetical protein
MYCTFLSFRECKRAVKVQPDADANLTDRADVPDDRLDVPAAVPASRLENPPTGGRSTAAAAAIPVEAKPTTAAVAVEARTDRVPKSLDFFDSTDTLVAPLKFEAPSARAQPAAAPRQQIVFEHQPVIEGRSFSSSSSQSKPVKFIEIFGEQDAITSP